MEGLTSVKERMKFVTIDSAPTAAWRIRMGWNDVCFAHWRVDAGALRATLPPGLELDLFDGEAWVSIVPFRMTQVQRRGFPVLPGFADVLEINVRTYVRAAGRPAIWFYSLDASSRIAVEGARILMSLPYFNASIAASHIGEEYRYRSERRDARAPAGRFAASWKVIGDAPRAEPGTIESFLHERYRLVTERHGTLGIADVAHAPWPLARIALDITENTLASTAQLELDHQPNLVFFAPHVEVTATSLRRLTTS